MTVEVCDTLRTFRKPQMLLIPESWYSWNSYDN